MSSPLVYLTGLFALGILAQWLAWRYRLPAILLLLLFGFATNVFVNADAIVDDKLLFPVVSLSVAIILFDGGLSLRFSEIKATSRAVVRLVTFGCVITWGLGTLAARLIFDDWRVATLAGAIYTVTGPTVIGPLLRHVRPTPRLSSIAKWEGIIIDPIGALLAVLVSLAVLADNTSEAIRDVGIAFGMTLLVSIPLALAAAYSLILLLKRHLVPDYLQSPLTLGIVLTSYTLSDVMQPESGLATVTILGIVMANQKSVSISHLIEFKENLGVLLIGALFILLASRFRFETMIDLGWPGIGFVVLQILLIRPISVFLSTIGTRLNQSEKLFLSVLAPRGIVAAAVSSVFAFEFAHMAELGAISHETAEQATSLVPLTFLMIVSTVSVYGLAAGPIARRLKLAEQNPQGVLFAGADELCRMAAAALVKEGFRVMLVDTNRTNIAAARMQNLPTCNASILSEFVHESVDYGGIGRLIAMTPNDQVNMLASLDFQEVFGRAEIYQLKPNVSEKQREALTRSAKRSRYVFAKGTTYEQLDDLLINGYRVKTSKITDEYTWETYQEHYGPSVIVLFLIQDKSLEICTDESDPIPVSGSTVIALVPPRAAGSSESTVIKPDQAVGESPSSEGGGMSST